MGVKLKDIIQSEKIDLKDLKGRTIAIDAFNTIYQFLSGIRQRDGMPLTDSNGNVTSHLSGLLYRTTLIVENDIKPIYVFDGVSSHLKNETILKRRKVREDSEKKWKNALERGDEEDARKYGMRSSKMTPYVLESSRKLLNLMGIPYIDAPGEGEAQAAYLVEKGDAWAVASQDYDCLLFGAKRTIRNLTLSGKINDLEFLNLKKILEYLNASHEDLVNIGVLVGTDFNDGMKGIGAKRGLRLLKSKKLESTVKQLKNETDQDVDTVKKIFLNPEVKTDYSIKWKNAKKEEVFKFMCDEHDFSFNRVENALNKLEKLNSKQKTLEDWF